ncbi:hypothetical protein, partial [Xanthomonas arboricola]
FRAALNSGVRGSYEFSQADSWAAVTSGHFGDSGYPKPSARVGLALRHLGALRGPRQHSLQFNADGTGLVIRAKGNVEFLHKHSGRSVSLLANANGYAIPIELTSSPGFDKLLLHSEKTGNTASYVKQGSTQSHTCGIK